VIEAGEVLDRLADRMHACKNRPSLDSYLETLHRDPLQVAEWLRRCKSEDYPE
jgi:hypothetical protein